MALDLAIVVTLLVLAWQAMFSRSLFAAMVFFISFSLVLALAWVRLHAPDVALAEAAIGAGVTGAMFLAALRRIEWSGPTTVVSETGRHNA
ncbi:MAG: Na(+)/H(+) antiporter subunit B [Planctomycetota bacterium]